MEHNQAVPGEKAPVENVAEMRRTCPDHGVRWCPECDDPDTGYGSVEVQGG